MRGLARPGPGISSAAAQDRRASEGADSSKTRFHRQMISIAAAITIPVTNAVKQEKSSRSFRTLLMAASRAGRGLFLERCAHLYRGGKVIYWDFGTRVLSFRLAGAQGQMINASSSMMPIPITSTASATGS